MADHEIVGDNGANGEKRLRTNYPSNSNKSKEKAVTDQKQEKRVDKVISGQAIERKKTLGRKIRETFSGDDMHSVANYILFEVVVPATKNMISDALSQGVERSLFGDASRGRRLSSNGSRNYTSYNRYSSSPTGRAGEADGPRALSQKARATHDFNEVVLATRGEAEQVLDSLSNVLNEYGIVSVSDLYSSVGITGNFTDEKWGWDDLRSAGVIHVREGYLLNLPKPAPID